MLFLLGFHAHGSNGSIIDDYNVSSVSRNGNGNYTINFSNNSPSSNLCCCRQWRMGFLEVVIEEYRLLVVVKDLVNLQVVFKVFNTNPATTQNFNPSKFHTIIFENT